ncbi:MAG: GNAT family N-acetyltransferase [Thermoplasmata archaeon]|nr:MAG: GNAT family N-acetyltransferase [Thermoplasmata archaeon]
MIRRVKIQDHSEIITLLKQLWPNAPPNPEELGGLVDQYIQNENYDIYCYEEDKILGIITFSKRHAFFYQGKVAIIEDLVIDEPHRGKGIGKELVEYVEEELKRQGILNIELSSDLQRTGAHEFWEKMGYTKSGYHFRKIFNNR